MTYVKITDREGSFVTRVPTDDDGTISIQVIKSQYPGAMGLKYSPDGDVWAIKISDGKFYPPEGGWADFIHCRRVFPKGKNKIHDIILHSNVR